MNIKKLLELFDLRQSETLIYEELLTGETLEASALAKRAGLSRTSVYDLLEHLTAAGLVAETNQNGIKKFFAQPPENIKLLISEKEIAFNDAKQVINELQKNFERRTTINKPKLQLFEGRQELQQMMKDLLLYRDITVQAYWPIKKITTVLTPEFLTKFHQERAERNIKLQVIWPTTQLSFIKTHPFLKNSLALKRECRVAPHSLDFSLGYTIYKNTVRFISSQKENFGFIVESAELAEMMKTQFKFIWEKSKVIK
jgi:sugar-specific transcriptional regulator TrmB